MVGGLISPDILLVHVTAVYHFIGSVWPLFLYVTLPIKCGRVRSHIYFICISVYCISLFGQLFIFILFELLHVQPCYSTLPLTTISGIFTFVIIIFPKSFWAHNYLNLKLVKFYLSKIDYTSVYFKRLIIYMQGRVGNASMPPKECYI